MSDILDEEQYTGELITRKQIKRSFTGKVDWQLPKPNEFLDLPAKIQKKETKRSTSTTEDKTTYDDDEVFTENDKEFKLSKRSGTVTIAVPSSIIDLSLILELKTILAGQISRFASMFQVDEIVVYKDLEPKDKKQIKSEDFFAKVLQYQETPQYLRKQFFPYCKELQFVGLLAPLEIPHHLRKTDFLPYREGIVTNTITTGQRGSMVDVGLEKEVFIPQMIQKGVRVTIQFDEGITLRSKSLTGNAVSPLVPHEKSNIYWGYRTRIAPSFQNIFDNCPFKEGYDISMGISPKATQYTIDPSFKLPKYKHLLIVFGGTEGIEESVQADEHLKTNETSSLFTYFVSPLVEHGCRSVRTEEMVLMTLSSLQTKLQ